jgi:hypothetical protein
MSVSGIFLKLFLESVATVAAAAGKHTNPYTIDLEGN